MTTCKLLLIASEASKMGKTALGTAIVSALRGQGRLCAVKHVHHGVDYRVKDTGRYLESGTNLVIAVGPHEVMSVERVSTDLAAILCKVCSSCDYIVVEGFKEQLDGVVAAGGCAAVITMDPTTWDRHVGSEKVLVITPGQIEMAVDGLVEMLRKNCNYIGCQHDAR